LGAAVAAARYQFGLGVTTNLSDAVPWGIWIGFDVMSGVALAAGGFVITATVYIFKLEKYHSIVRPAVLTALLGYIAVAVGLLFDLGLPWNIWHMIVYWNVHSPLFEVGWCVMLYLTVLMLEFFPVPAEGVGRLAGLRRRLEKLRLPLVITGIALSTLHQSSLGSLFLIMPYNLHPLWYSPLLPINFFISAVGLGLLMVTLESLFSSYLYRRQPERDLLAGLTGAARWVILAYLMVRLGDLGLRGQLNHLSDSGWQPVMFWVELGLMGFIPLVLLFIPGLRRSTMGLWTVALMGVSGVVLNRINVGGLAHLGRGELLYLPAWTEIAISAAVVAAAALVFLFMVERFRIWEQRPTDPEDEPLSAPQFHPLDLTWFGSSGRAARTRYSLGFIIAAAVGFMLISGHPLESRGVPNIPARRALGGDTLQIDGNRDGFGTRLLHKAHAARLDTAGGCIRCHHMNLPGDRNSSCSSCHRMMYLPSDAFRHDWHTASDGGDLACHRCHPAGRPKTAATASSCSDCHRDLIPPDALIRVDSYEAPGYVEAMHRLCQGCHATVARERGKPELAQCVKCHTERRRLVELQKDGTNIDMTVNPVLPPLETR